MVGVEYSEYPVSYQPAETDINDTPVIEGIANFCELNRSYANQYRQGWNNLTNAISNSTSQQTTASTAQQTNALLQTGGVSTAQINRYPYTCGDIRGKIFKQDGTTVSPNGTIYAYSTDLKIMRGSASVNANGEFKELNVKLKDETEKFVFAYEDTTFRLWSVDIKSGSGTSGRASCSNNKYYALKLANRKSFGDSVGQTRDPNGKLINTEQKNSGAELRYNGMKAIYTETIANTMNLGIGVLAAIVFIAKTQ